MEPGALMKELAAKKHYIVRAFLVTAGLWVLAFGYLIVFSIPGQFEKAVVRSLATAAFLAVSTALAVGPLVVLKPGWNLVRYRRTLGVAGFTLAAAHGASAIFLIGASPLADLNPLRNPVILGTLALAAFLPLVLTSTDWAIRSLSFSNWKRLHRIVYVGYFLAVAHMALVRPGHVSFSLLSVAAAVYVLQLAAWATKVKKKETNLDAGLGAALAAIGVALIGYALFTALASTH